MLARLSIRDIVLIERLDIEFSRGLAVLTGETGAGKSILLDAFALALGGRGDAGPGPPWRRAGPGHRGVRRPEGPSGLGDPRDNGLDDTGEMILRRVQLADGRTRAFINDQAISVQTLKAVGSALVEIHGQHDERALVDASTHRRLLDAFAGLEKDVAALETLWDARRAANAALDEHRAGMERAAREADYLRHAADELKKLKPKDGEETALAERRTTMMQGEKIASRPARGAGRGRRPPFAGAGAVGGGAPAGAPRRQFAGAGRARGEGDRRRDQRAGRGRPASDARRWSRPISIRPSSSASRSGCSRCAPPRANIRRRSTGWPRWPRNTPPTWR